MPALSQRFSAHPARRAMCLRGRCGQSGGGQAWTGLLLQALLPPRQICSNPTTLRTLRSSSQDTTAAPSSTTTTPRPGAVVCSQQPVSWGSSPPFHISAVRRLGPGIIATPHPVNPTRIASRHPLMKQVRMKQVFTESACFAPYITDTEMLGIPSLTGLKSMMNTSIKCARVACIR